MLNEWQAALSDNIYTNVVSHGQINHTVVVPTDQTTRAALLENNEATAKSTSQDGGMAVNFG